jgi:hypothetical protein
METPSAEKKSSINTDNVLRLRASNIRINNQNEENEHESGEPTHNMFFLGNDADNM